jgi:SMODS-associated and fused to various effectors sensor domain/CobQ/CobB/MinD/ParA nucleotide binding domain
MTNRGVITTFYSYKGGVGRSMAVANVATLLAQKGRRVLVMDFDLEAAGIHRYFVDPNQSDRPGLIDFFIDLRAGLAKEFSEPESFTPTDPSALAICRKLVTNLLNNNEFFMPVDLAMPVDPAAKLDVMSAGRFDDDYVERMRLFDWRTLFADFAEVFGVLREELCLRYDDVLIDARTGLSDTGSISTVVLPDRLVIAFVPNEQSLVGGVDVARQAHALHAQNQDVKRTSQPLKIIPLLSRVDAGAKEKRISWMTRAARDFADLFKEIEMDSEVDMLSFFLDLHIPHDPEYAYGEQIVTSEATDRGFGSVFEAYSRFTACLMHEGSLASFQSRRKLEDASDDHALLVQFGARFKLPTLWPFRRVFQVPDENSSRDWGLLRGGSIDVSAWQEVITSIDQAIHAAKRDFRGNLHVFPMAPYPAAALVGRRLDDLARGVPVYVYQFDSVTSDWILFSSPGAPRDRKPFFRDAQELVTGTVNGDVVLAIEGRLQLNDETLRLFASKTGASRIVRLRQMNDDSVDLRLQAANAVDDVRRALMRIRAAWPTAALHIVATAPVALLVEVGRMLSPTVYRKATIYQYDPNTASYEVGLDMIARAVVRHEETARA